VPEADVRIAPAGALLIDGQEVGWEAHRPATLGVEADPARDGLDRRAVAADRGPALGREAPDAAAEGAQLELFAEAREGLDPNAVAPDDPGALALESRVDDVGVGDVLQPARDRVQPAAAGAVGVGYPGPGPLLVDPAATPVDKLVYLSSSSESRRRSIIDERSGI
jgi:hypothetical protein